MNKMQPDVDEREIIRETFSKILQRLKKGLTMLSLLKAICKSISISLMDIIARNKSILYLNK